MSTEIKKEIQLEIGHVLSMDIVGYSTRLITEQRALRDVLNQIVRGTEQFRAADAAGTLIKSPTGDGMALVLHRSAEEPPKSLARNWVDFRNDNYPKFEDGAFCVAVLH